CLTCRRSRDRRHCAGSGQRPRHPPPAAPRHFRSCDKPHLRPCSAMMFTFLSRGCKAFSAFDGCCNLFPMRPHTRLFSAALAALLAAPLGAATISGSVFDDTRALANRADFAPLPGVTVHAWRDGGDGLPSGADDKAAGDAV